MSSSEAAELRKHTAAMAGLFQSRVSSFKNRSDLTSLVKRLNKSAAVTTATETWGEGDWECVGIDGSMDFDERMQMILFYVSGTGYRCPLTVSKSDVTIGLRKLQRDQNLSVTAAVPIWVEDAAALSRQQLGETEFDFNYSMQGIPYALMLMAELNLARAAAMEESTKLVFLDRPLSSTFPSILNDLRMLLRLRSSSLLGITTPKGQVTKLDLQLGAVLGSGQRYLPARGQHLVARAIRELMSGEKAREQLVSALGLDRDGFDNLVKRLARFDQLEDGMLLDHCDLTSIMIRDGVKDYWERLIDATQQVLDKVFHTRGEHPLLMGEDKWLTVLDLNAINLFLLLMLLDVASNGNKTIVGIAKDTTATDLTRAVFPYLAWRGDLKTDKPLPQVRNDRAFLAILSATNNKEVEPPWRFIAYDSCFTTLMDNNDPEIPLRAARKVVASEQLFVRTYFQLRSFKTDSAMRSPVFLCDRPFCSKSDPKFTREFDVLERAHSQRLDPFFEDGDFSELDNLLLYLLSLSDNPEVIEAFGHNQLLYLADKAVKLRVKSMRSTLRGVADLELSSLARRERIFTILSRHRDMRADSELRRKRFARNA